MTSALDLLKAPRYGIRDFKTRLSERMRSKDAMVIVDHGQPKKVVLDYDEIVQLLEFIEDVQDKEVLQLLQEGRAAIDRGESGISAEESLKKIRSARKKS